MKPGTGKKVVVAMSGGVDSSVTAALLKDDGYEVVGCFMRSGEEGSGVRSPESGVDDSDSACCIADPKPQTPDPGPTDPRPSHRQGCCSANDAADARLVAALLGIPFYVLNFRKDFGRIKDYFAAEYHAGRTPNPCVRCNDWLKFGKLFDHARSIDADFIATGHYARVVPPSSPSTPHPTPHTPHPQLLRGLDHHKDQSYVLFGLPREKLARMLLPIGHLHKPQVRQIALDKGLPVFDKPDSYEICFIPDNDYRGFLERRDPAAFHRGALLDTAGQVIGEHEGHQHFTLGQRRGLPVTAGFPLYVIHKDAASNTVTLGRREESLAASLIADQTNWHLDEPPTQPMRVTVKIRSNSDPVPGEVWVPGVGELAVRFDEPQHAVTPGQAVVCYDGEVLIGGGWIREAH